MNVVVELGNTALQKAKVLLETYSDTSFLTQKNSIVSAFFQKISR